MEKRGIFFLVFVAVILAAGFALATPVSDDIHVNIQTTYTNGSIETGTFAFVFNISTSSGCGASTVLYSHSASLTTDSNGVISYYLPNVTLPFDQQYWLCYYRDGTLIDNAELSRSPYAFFAKNVTLSGVVVDTNFNMTSYNVSTSGTGFFGYLGSLLNRIVNLFAVNGNFENLNVTNLTVTNFNFNGSVAHVNASGTEGAVQYNSNGELGGNANLFFVNSSTGFIGVNTSSPQNLLNVRGNANVTGVLIVEGKNIVQGYLYATNGTYYLSSNPYSFYNSTTLANVSQLANNYNYFNSTTLVNVSQLANDAGYYNSSNLPTGLTWAEVTNGTLYLSSNPYSFYNSSDFNISDYYLASNPYGYYNSTNPPPAASSVWNQTGSSIYPYNLSWNVGIGTKSPQNTLNVLGDANVTGSVYVGSARIFTQGGNMIFRI